MVAVALVAATTLLPSPSHAFVGLPQPSQPHRKRARPWAQPPCFSASPVSTTTTIPTLFPTPTPEDMALYSDRLHTLDMLAPLPVAIVQSRLEHLHTLFPSENATSMAYRLPDLLRVEPVDLAHRVAERQVQLETLLPACRPLRMMAKIPALVLQDFDAQIKRVAENLRREFPKMDLARVVYQNPIVLAREWDSLLLPKITALRALFPKQDLGKMIARRPDLLSRDVEGKMKEKLEGLAALLPSVNVQELVARQPDLLARDLSLISSRITHLRSLFPSSASDEIFTMISRKPTLLLADADRILGPKLEHLKRLLGSAAAQELCQAMPTIFNRDLDKVEDRLGALMAHLPGIDVVRFLKLNPAFLTEPGGDVSGHVAALQAVLPSGMELAKLLAQEPQLYTEEAAVLALKLNEVRATTGLEEEEVAVRLERDARFLIVPYGLLAARLRFLTAWQQVSAAGKEEEEKEKEGEEERKKALQRINLSSLACMPLDRFLVLYPAYPHYLASKLGGKWAPSTEDKNAFRLEKVYSGVLWRQTGLVYGRARTAPSGNSGGGGGYHRVGGGGGGGGGGRGGGGGHWKKGPHQQQGRLKTYKAKSPAMSPQ